MDARLRRSFTNIIARVMAGLAHGLYGFLSFIFRQLFPDTAESEYLERWSNFWGVPRKAATKATGVLDCTGTDGATVSVGDKLSRADGVQFEVTVGGTISGGVLSITVEALDAGLDGNTDATTELTFVSTPSGVDSITTVDANALTGGTDLEDDESLLPRLLDRIQTPPQGGSENDYITWALEVPGVTRAWVYPQELGAGTVTVRFMMDDTYPDGIPLAADVATVQAYIDDLRPVTADVTVVAPVASALDIDITLNIETGSEVEAAVQTELAALILRDAEPGGTIYLSRINEAISIATGEFDHSLDDPVANVTHTTGQIATLGTVTFS